MAGKNNALQNGVAKTQLSGAAASSQEFKLTLPANTQTLMIQSGASDQVELHLLDADKNPIPACSATTFCRTDFAPAGVYYVQLNGLGQFNNLSLVASWSGPDIATLKNAQPVTGLSGKAGTVILQLVDEGKVSLDDPVSKYGVALPKTGWTWNDLLTTATAMTRDARPFNGSKRAIFPPEIVTGG